MDISIAIQFYLGIDWFINQLHIIVGYYRQWGWYTIIPGAPRFYVCWFINPSNYTRSCLFNWNHATCGWLTRCFLSCNLGFLSSYLKLTWLATPLQYAQYYLYNMFSTWKGLWKCVPWQAAGLFKRQTRIRLPSLAEAIRPSDSDWYVPHCGDANRLHLTGSMMMSFGLGQGASWIYQSTIVC